MSLTNLPYQPLPFGLPTNCTLDCANWIQKIERSDTTSVQFGYAPCGTTWTVLTGGDFSGGGANWSQIGAWTFSGGVATSPIGTVGTLFQSFPQTTSELYQLSFYCTVNNGDLLVGDNVNFFESTNTSGYKEYVFDASSTTEIVFAFNEPLGGNISNIQLKPINADVRVDVVDLDNVSQATIPSTDLSYTDGFVTLNIDDWDGLSLPDGCYKLAVYDPCECSQFGFVGDDFVTPNQWRVITGAFNLSGGAMQFGFFGTTQVRSRALLCPDTEYEISYTLSGMGVGDDFQVRIGTTNGTTRTTDGSYTETLSTNFTGDIEVRFIVTNTGSFEVSNFSIEAVTPIVSSYSVPFELKDDHDCTVLVEACGDSNQFNFGFDGSGFKPKVRLESTYRTSSYPITRTGYEYSNGFKKVPYMRTRQAKSLLFGAPEYIHDFMNLLLGFDNVYIEGVVMASEDEEYPTPSLEQDVDLATVTMTFSKQELVEKRSCSSLPPLGCEENGVSILVRGTGGYVKPSTLLDIAGRTILIN